MKTATQKTRPFTRYADVPKTYSELCQLYLPRPIHDDAEDTAATAMMNALAVFVQLNAEQRDYPSFSFQRKEGKLCNFDVASFLVF